MEEILNEVREQPTTSDEQTLAQEEQETLNSESKNAILQDTAKLGSLKGKFKTVESLEKAYENLEKEFTKKCQQLKELESKSESDNANAPQYTLNDWQDKVKEFFNQNPKAKQFVDEISELLSSDKVLASKENSLELAYGKILNDKYQTTEQLVNNEQFLQQVINNAVVKEKIINNYLNEITNNKAVPLMGSGNGNIPLTPNYKPTTLKEAGVVAKALLNI